MTLRALGALLALLAVVGASHLSAQAPFVVDGQSALTKEDGPCFDNANRYVDCGNGTVTDTVAGLVWLQRANCTELPGTGGTNSDDWATAMQAAAGLEDGLCGLTDGSEPGDWRLPTQLEWEAALEYARDTLGCTGAAGPVWTNDAGTACITTPVTSFIGVAAQAYWSASVDQVTTGAVDFASLGTGTTTTNLFKFGNASIWPVRGTCVGTLCTE